MTYSTRRKTAALDGPRVELGVLPDQTPSPSGVARDILLGTFGARGTLTRRQGGQRGGRDVYAQGGGRDR